MVFTAALVCALVAWRLRQPLILGYVFAGLILSPFTPGLRVHDVPIFEVMAEIGVILLMFSVGIEFPKGAPARATHFTRRRSGMENSMPTENMSRMTPISAMTSKMGTSCTRRPGVNGLRMRPAKT